jgi:hypothetical protein
VKNTNQGGRNEKGNEDYGAKIGHMEKHVEAGNPRAPSNDKVWSIWSTVCEDPKKI